MKTKDELLADIAEARQQTREAMQMIGKANRAVYEHAVAANVDMHAHHSGAIATRAMMLAFDAEAVLDGLQKFVES